jgi:ATP-dependent Clp protease ATP-binding subunit ClpC
MIEDPLSEEILRGTFKGFDMLTVKLGDAEEGGKKLEFSPSKKGEEPVPAGAGAGGGEKSPA